VSNLVPFEFETNNVRIIMDENNQPMFVAKDVATVLGYANVKEAIKRHCRTGSRKLYPIIDSLGRTQNVRVIYEPDVYRLIIGSRLPSAQRFERWVFEEVLPSIRKTGQYQIQPQTPTLNDPVLQALTIMLAELDAVKSNQARMSQEQAEMDQRQREAELNSLKRDRKLARNQAELDRKFQAIETAQDYFTMLGWWHLTFTTPLDNTKAAKYGRMASRYCREHGFEIGQISDPRFGLVNTYPREVLELLFLD
jgi:prophage antirepressor-like protein